MIAYDLTTQHMTNPMGIDALHPMLSWKCADGVRQSAYRIQSAETEDDLVTERLLWDSGDIASEESLNIKCPANQEMK